MTSLTYHRPQTLDEALALLERGLPLGGGTWLTPRRRTLTGVVDLQDLGLTIFEAGPSSLRAGASLSLENLYQHLKEDMMALAPAVRREMALNMRQQATLGGLLHAAGSRSTLLTCLLSLGASVRLEPGDLTLPLPELLKQRQDKRNGYLVTELSVPRPDALAFDIVARSPMDLPIVVAAASRFDSDGSRRYLLALGGYGLHPILLPEAGEALAAGEVDAAGAAAESAYSQAADAWASAAYRSQVAGVLARRVAREVVGS
jgi:CO/xanthine dehydrogenase FAD-binding subunit